MTTRIIGSSSQSGGSAFSGAAIDNTSTGITLVNDVGAIPHFIRTLYDTDSYVNNLFQITTPKQGYYGVHLSFISDSPFIGHWEIGVAGMNGPAPLLSGNSVSGQNPEDFLYTEAHFDALAVVTPSLTQTSGADQLVYPVMRIHYLGS